MNTQAEKTRSLSLDLIRIFAVLAIIMLHTSAPFANLQPGTSAFLCGSIFNGFSRIGVPLFVMVSGALMLDENKEIPIKKLFSKHILNILLLFVSWSAIYTAYIGAKEILKGQPVAVSNIIKQFLTGEYHMWYLIMIIGVYLTVPVLKLFVKKENSNEIKYILSVSAAFSFLPAILSVLSRYSGLFALLNWELSRFHYGFIGIFPVYFLTGWYIYHVGIKHKKTIYLSAMLSILFMILLVQLTGKHESFYSNDSIPVYLYAVGVFTFINEACKNKHCTKIIEKLSNLTFGAYIIHVAIMQILSMFFDITILTPVTVIIRFTLITVISFAGSYVISKIPVIKKLVRF